MTKRNPEKLFPLDHILKFFILPFPKAVKPNHLTVFRFLITPLVLWFLYVENWKIGIPLFVFASFTDALDGTMARVRKEVTKWGTFYDPVADKFLIGSVVLLIVVRYVNPLIALSIIVLELLLILGGWYRRRRHLSTQANIWGKIKMILEFVAVMFLLIALAFGVDLFVDISQGTLVLAIIFAIVSLLTYSL